MLKLKKQNNHEDYNLKKKILTKNIAQILYEDA